MNITYFSSTGHHPDTENSWPWVPYDQVPASFFNDFPKISLPVSLQNISIIFTLPSRSFPVVPVLASNARSLQVQGLRMLHIRLN